MEERLALLERRLTRHVLIGALLLLVLPILVLTAGQVMGKNNQISAQRFVLVDANGNECGEWKVSGSAPQFSLRSADGKRTVYISINDDPQDTTGIAIYNNGMHAKLQTYKGTGNLRYGQVYLSSIQNSAELVSGEDMAPSFRLSQNGKVRVLAEAQPSRSSVSVVYDNHKAKLEVP